MLMEKLITIALSYETMNICYLHTYLKLYYQILKVTNLSKKIHVV